MSNLESLILNEFSWPGALTNCLNTLLNDTLVIVGLNMKTLNVT